MPPFRTDDLRGLDWRLFQNGSTVQYSNKEVMSGDVAWLRDKGYEVFELSCDSWSSEQAMHEDFLRTFHFPAYYGKNLDAFRDFMTDTDVLRAVLGHVVVFRQFDVLPGDKREPEKLRWILLDILAEASRFRLLGID